VRCFFASDDSRLREWGGVVCSTAASRPSEGPGNHINTDSEKYLSYAIVGFGAVRPGPLPYAFARKNIDVAVASRGARVVGAAGSASWDSDGRPAKSLRECTRRADTYLAVPFGEHREVAKALPKLERQDVIDAMKRVSSALEELDGLPVLRLRREGVFNTAPKLVGFNT